MRIDHLNHIFILFFFFTSKYFWSSRNQIECRWGESKDITASCQTNAYILGSLLKNHHYSSIRVSQNCQSSLKVLFCKHGQSFVLGLFILFSPFAPGFQPRFNWWNDFGCYDHGWVGYFLSFKCCCLSLLLYFIVCHLHRSLLYLQFSVALQSLCWFCQWLRQLAAGNWRISWSIFFVVWYKWTWFWASCDPFEVKILCSWLSCSMQAGYIFQQKNVLVWHNLERKTLDDVCLILWCRKSHSKYIQKKLGKR